MRVQLLMLGLLSVGCPPYAPAVPDCSLACSEEGTCPGGMRCDGTYCRPAGNEGACECRAQESRPCGTELGECARGIQVCSARGTWGPCQGAVEPSPEVCDGLDNDCDGLVDKGPLVQLADDQRGPFALFGFDGGYGLVYGRAADAGEEADPGTFDVVVVRYDTHFTATAPPEVVASGLTSYAWASSGAEVYVGWGEDGGLVVRAAAPGAEARDFAVLPQAEVMDQLQLGLGENLVAAWRTPYPNNWRLARWSEDGRLEDVVGPSRSLLLAGYDWDAGFPTYMGLGLTDRGHVAAFDFNMTSPAGALTLYGFTLDTRTFEVLSRYSGCCEKGYTWRLLEKPSGRVACTSYNSIPGYFWVDYHDDVLAPYPTRELLEHAQVSSSWVGLDSAVRPGGDVYVATADRSYRRIRLARIVEDPYSSTPIISRYDLPPADGFGVPRIAQSGGEQMLGMAFAEGGRISARPLCGIDW